MPRIIIEQQRASIGINTTFARMNIHPKRPQMKVESSMPRMTVNREQPEFEVNNKKIQSESGLMRPAELSLSVRDNGKLKADMSVSDIVDEGNFLSDVTAPGNRVAQFARNKTLRDANKEINIGLMPKSSPEITWKTGSMDISWSRNNFNIDWSETNYMPDFSVEPKYSVEVFLRNKPYIRISVVDGSAGGPVGRAIDAVL
jgi:hypothetical protein